PSASATPTMTTAAPANRFHVTGSPNATAPSATATTGTTNVTSDADVAPTSRMSELNTTYAMPVPNAPRTRIAPDTAYVGCNRPPPNGTAATSSTDANVSWMPVCTAVSRPRGETWRRV